MVKFNLKIQESVEREHVGGAIFVVCRNIVNNTRHCTAAVAANKKIDPAKVMVLSLIHI